METAFREVEPNVWELPATGAMRVPGRIFASRELVDALDEKVREQLANVASLPGIVGAAYAMPDAHWGYGFPDRRRRGLRSGAGRHHLGGRRRLRHLLRRAHVHDRAEGGRDLREEGDAGARPLPDGSGGRGLGRRRPADGRRARSGPAREAPGGPSSSGWGDSAELEHDRGARMHEGADPVQGEPARQGAAASRDGNARFRESLSGAAGRRRDLRCGSRARVRPGSRRPAGHDPLRFARPRPPDRHRLPATSPARPRRGTASRCPDRELSCAPIRSPEGRGLSGSDAGGHQLRAGEPPGHRRPRAPGLRRHFPRPKLELLYDVSHNTCKAEEHVDRRATRGSSTFTARARPARSGRIIRSCPPILATPVSPS